ncbi:MAG TPA: mannosyltransferase family protein [Acidimicrobiales bacterium]|nr:mannosyltransferase family protein [Acidimicrobiales bacterium]
MPWILRVALVPWALARAVVLGAVVLSHQLADGLGVQPAVAARVREGLLGWDAGWYEAIARHGYAGAGHPSLRFFPLLPLLAKLVSLVPGVDAGAAVVIVANAAALAAVAVLVALVRRETGDDGWAVRSAWLVCLVPPAFTLVMGYAESVFLLLAVGTFLALRSERWWAAAGLAFLAGLARPLGLILVLPAAVEVWRRWPGSAGRRRVGAVAAVVGAPAGAGAYLAWVGWRYGDALAPVRVQTDPSRRGGFADPTVTFAHDLRHLVHGEHLGQGLHLPWALLALAMTVVAFRLLPVSYGLFAAAVVAVCLTAPNLDGFERYAASAFPLVVAGAGLLRDGRLERAVYVLAAAGLAGYSVLAFMNLYTP